MSEKIIKTNTVKAVGPKVTLDHAAETKEILDKQEKVSFIVPIGEDEKEGSLDTVQINGYKMEVPKGQLVELPVSVVKILSEKYKINMEAGRSSRLDLNPTKMAAL